MKHRLTSAVRMMSWMAVRVSEGPARDVALDRHSGPAPAEQGPQPATNMSSWYWRLYKVLLVRLMELVLLAAVHLALSPCIGSHHCIPSDPWLPLLLMPACRSHSPPSAALPPCITPLAVVVHDCPSTWDGGAATVAPRSWLLACPSVLTNPVRLSHAHKDRGRTSPLSALVVTSADALQFL
jgi:hypothetical protein